MDNAHAGLKQQPFHTRGQPSVVVHYQSEQAAHNYLRMIAASDRGIGLLFGPKFSGKKTLIRYFIRSLPENRAVAVVNGSRLNTTIFLRAIRSSYGYKIRSRSADDALNELEEFILHEAREGRVPLLVVDNIDEMYPSALRVLCDLAKFKVQGRFALRMILISGKPSYNIIQAPAMTAIAVRAFGAFEMGPMTPEETSRYLYAKLRAGGCVSPDSVMPADICNELHKMSRGLPGILDGLVMQAIERARNWPISYEHIYPPARQTIPVDPPNLSVVKDVAGPEVQKLYLTLNRETLQEFELTESRVLIGRADICDVSINSRFVSKHHALLIRNDDAMHLIDLNSINGTFVNSRRVASAVLQHDDVISLGNHGIKLIAPAYRARPASIQPDLADTTTMKTLEDLRHSGDASAETDPAEQRDT